MPNKAVPALPSDLAYPAIVFPSLFGPGRGFWLANNPLSGLKTILLDSQGHW